MGQLQKVWFGLSVFGQRLCTAELFTELPGWHLLRFRSIFCMSTLDLVLYQYCLLRVIFLGRKQRYGEYEGKAGRIRGLRVLTDRRLPAYGALGEHTTPE